jgi:hypothetical protein
LNWHLNDAAAGLVSPDPVTDLHHTGIEEPDVNHVAAKGFKLNAIARAVHLPGKYRNPSGNTQQWISQRDGNSCADQSQEGPTAA